MLFLIVTAVVIALTLGAITGIGLASKSSLIVATLFGPPFASMVIAVQATPPAGPEARACEGAHFGTRHGRRPHGQGEGRRTPLDGYSQR